MSNLIDPDRPLLAFITKMAYSAYLNILWLICCLPIVTIGASTTALFYVTLKMAEDRDDGLTGMFFRAFRQKLPASHQTLAGFVGRRGVSGNGRLYRLAYLEPEHILDARRRFAHRGGALSTRWFCCMRSRCWRGSRTRHSAFSKLPCWWGCATLSARC